MRRVNNTATVSDTSLSLSLSLLLRNLRRTRLTSKNVVVADSQNFRRRTMKGRRVQDGETSIF